MRKLLLLTFSFLISLFSVNQSNATKMLHRNAEELVSLSERIFVGICVSVEEQQLDFSNGSPLTYTEYTFEVLQSIKGTGSETVVLRQVGLAKGPGSIIGMPAYDIDKKYLLFLRGDSEYGLASPIGLGQGAFKILKPKDGPELAINAFNNRGLFHRMNSQTLSKTAALPPEEKTILSQTHGPVDLENFISLIKIISD
ncbi:hypothetical protein IH970_02295 [candidate division KSB1 bacterium]|nr:hypothetical protein [candidate division KSB1 bacterium]